MQQQTQVLVLKDLSLKVGLWKKTTPDFFSSVCLRMVYIPVDTGRKLNVHNTFRRRHGRLLNVLCTFSLRPVPTGTAAETPVLSASPDRCNSTDCTMLLNNSMLLGISVCCGKLSDHLIRFFKRNVGNSPSEGNFKSQDCRYISLNISVIVVIMLRGSKMDTISFNIPLFVFSFTVAFKFASKVSLLFHSILFHSTPKIMESVKFVSSSSLA